jgi:hypothetical protein
MAIKYRAEKLRIVARYDIRPSLAREIGRFMVAWAHFEAYVQGVVWSALQLSAEQGRIAVREPRVTDRLDMIRDLGELADMEMDYVLLRDIRKRADTLAAKRHLLAHSIWNFDSVSAEWCALVTRGSWAETQEDIENYPIGSKAVEPEARPITTKEVSEWVAQTSKLIEDLKKLGDQHRVVPPPSPQKRQPRSQRRNQNPGQTD